MNIPKCNKNINIVDISSLKNDKYWLNIYGAPDELSWSITGIYIPGLSIGNEQIFVKDFPLNTSGDTISTEPCVIEFKISNNLKNYLFFVIWMQKLINNDSEDKDISVYVTDSANQPKSIGFKLKRAFPINLSGIKFSIEEETIDLRATVTFMIDIWHISINGNEITNNKEYVLGNSEDCNIQNLKEELSRGLNKA
jgi:hypothetical protein